MDTQVEFVVLRKSYFKDQFNQKNIERKPKHHRLIPVEKFNWKQWEQDYESAS